VPQTLFTALAQRTLTKTIGDADQIAASHVYLMENRFVTGTVLTVDGGYVLTGSQGPPVSMIWVDGARITHANHPEHG
jgi:hypothetical protein